jgi:quercetin dioxygenase-like cupin family protein
MNAVAKGAHIVELKTSMHNAVNSGELIQIEAPVDHYHTPELYGRRIYVPAGATVVTKVHKSEHITVALKGHCVVVDEIGDRKDIVAPAVFITKPGTQRAVYAVTDVEWLTVHACEEQAMEKIEKILVCDTMSEYNSLQIEDKL